MMTITLPRWLVATALMSAGIGMLGLYGPTGSAQQPQPLPFANSVEQRGEILKELREIKELLKEEVSLIRQATQPEDAKTK